MKHALKLALASLALACSSMASAAMYQVNIDTKALEGQGGFVSFGLNGLADSPLVKALVSQYKGTSLEFIDQDNSFNVQGDLASSLKFSNALPSQFTQAVVFGKKLQFNVEFDASPAQLGSGTSFAFYVLDKAYGALLSSDPSGAAILGEFVPGQASSFVSAKGADGLALGNISAVPEPETYALIGLGLLSLAVQRRRSAYINI